MAANGQTNLSGATPYLSLWRRCDLTPNLVRIGARVREGGAAAICDHRDADQAQCEDVTQSQVYLVQPWRASASRS